MYDFTRQNAQHIAQLTKKVEELAKRVSDLERGSSGTREILTLPKNRTTKPKTANA